MRAANAFASAFMVASPNVERISSDFPDLAFTRGNFILSFFTQAGIYMEPPFFQLANQIRMSFRFAARAPAMALSTKVKSKPSSEGSMSSQETAAITLFRFFLAIRFQMGFI